MSENGQIKGFFNNLIAGAAWDAIKRGLGCSLVTGLVTALWEKLRHGSLDWYAISGMFVVTLAVVVSIFWKRGRFEDGKGTNSKETPEPKLKIHRAVYGIGPQADIDITRSLQKRTREGLVIPVDNSLVDHDPALHTRKRLELRYSYGDGTERYVYRLESIPGEIVRLVLPEDSEVQRLAAELSHCQAESSDKIAKALNEKAIAENKAVQFEAKVKGLSGKRPSAQYPIPALRLKVLETCTELQAFLGTYGDKVKVERRPEESYEDCMTRIKLPDAQQSRIKFVGEYALKFGESVPRLRDEIRAKCGINDDKLNDAIAFAQSGSAGSADAVERAIARFWEIAPSINV